MLTLNKPCKIEDFSDSDLISVMKKLVSPDESGDADWPRGREYRKHWEMGMAVLAMQRHLPADRRGFALGVGAGTEATSFFLTNIFRWVFATDLYFTQDWEMNSPSAMLHAPERFAKSIPFKPRRLVTQHMDGRALRYEDETFDFVYSCGSIEHFGDRQEIRQAVAEMGRVLKPDGIMAISTELCVEGGHGYLRPDILLFGPEEVFELIIAPSGCKPVDVPRFSVSEATLKEKVPFREALADLQRMHTGSQRGWSRYPHIVVQHEKESWTSYQIALRK